MKRAAPAPCKLVLELVRGGRRDGMAPCQKVGDHGPDHVAEWNETRADRRRVTFRAGDAYDLDAGELRPLDAYGITVSVDELLAATRARAAR